MQYLLSKEEYDTLVHAKELAKEELRKEFEVQMDAARGAVTRELAEVLHRWSSGRPLGYEWQDGLPGGFLKDFRDAINKTWKLPE